MRGRERYTWFAPVYDLLSGERRVYRAGRVTGINALLLRPGALVLDIGCGTGLSFPLIRAALGPTGRIVGVDASLDMLARARAQTERLGWENIDLVCADATTLTQASFRESLGHGHDTNGHDTNGHDTNGHDTNGHDTNGHDTNGHDTNGHDTNGADAVLFAYSLSVMTDWPQAWRAVTAAARPGARVAVVDMRTPTGNATGFAPLARLACALGGSDINAHPWTSLERDCTDVRAWNLRGGHIQVRAGTLRQQ